MSMSLKQRLTISDSILTLKRLLAGGRTIYLKANEEGDSLQSDLIR